MGLEKRAFSFGNALPRRFEEWLEKSVHLFRMAMVRVQSDQYIVLLRQNMGGLGKYDGPEGRVLYTKTRSELAASGRNLDDAIRFRIGERLEGGIDGHDRGDVYRWVRVAAFLSGIQHGFVLLRCGDRHGS